MKLSKIGIAAILLAPFVLGSCATRAGTAVAGAATYRAIDEHQEQEQREDYAKAKYAQDKKHGNRR
jgi:hypothetical protein